MVGGGATCPRSEGASLAGTLAWVRSGWVRFAWVDARDQRGGDPAGGAGSGPTGSGAGMRRGRGLPATARSSPPCSRGRATVEFTHRVASGIALISARWSSPCGCSGSSERGHLARKGGAVLSVVAIIGGGAPLVAWLVLAALVGSDQSVARAVSVPLPPGQHAAAAGGVDPHRLLGGRRRTGFVPASNRNFAIWAGAIAVGTGSWSPRRPGRSPPLPTPSSPRQRLASPLAAGRFGASAHPDAGRSTRSPPPPSAWALLPAGPPALVGRLMGTAGVARLLRRAGLVLQIGGRLGQRVALLTPVWMPAFTICC